MAILTFEELSFRPHDKEKIRVNFHKRFYFDIDSSKLQTIGQFTIAGNKIDFKGIPEQSARRKFSQLVSHHINSSLRHAINNKRTFYIHANSGIPLIGTPYFGIIDRDTNVLEIRPNTGCNFNCIYCSVDEGFISKRITDYFVESSYLVSELKKIVALKGCTIDIHIGSQGEPTLYPDMVELIKAIRADIPKIRHIAMVTNGSLLTKEYINQLAEAGLTRINLSLNTLDFKVARQLAGVQFDAKRVMELARYIPTKMDLIIAPLWVPGYNDDFLELVRFAKSIGAGRIGPAIGIQNFLPYKRGRNPVKPASEAEFKQKMREIEQKEGIKLIYDIAKPAKSSCKNLPKPMKKGELIKAELKMPGRFRDEVLGVAKERCISIIGYPSEQFKEGSIVKAKVIRTKHNIYAAKFIVLL